MNGLCLYIWIHVGIFSQTLAFCLLKKVDVKDADAQSTLQNAKNPLV